MAGDWIKVEHATVDKPEIARIADLLGVRPNEALGLMVSFWVWCDRHARNGVVTHMSRTTLDNVTHTPGFAVCLIDVGWAQIDDETGAITITNHDRHNGNPAKTRALGRDRAVTHRSRESNAEPVTRLDKKKITTERERIDAPTDEHRQLASTLKLDCEVEWLKYRDQQANAPRKHSDLQAGFRNWLRRAKEFQPQPRPGPAKQEARARVADDIWKGVDDGRSNERVIDGQAERVA